MSEGLMPRKSGHPRRPHPEGPLQRKHPKVGARRIVRTIAQGTVLAVGLAAAQFAIPDNDPRFSIFNKTLVDRLQAPITRYHE
jgi:hypothetical protein